MDAESEGTIVRAGVFLVVLVLVWVAAGILFENAMAGFFVGLIAAAFAVGAATLKHNRDGSWSLRKHK